MTGVLVRKLLRDVRVPLIVVALLIVLFQCLWVKVAQRTVTQLSPFFSTMAARAGVLQKTIEEMVFSGPGKVMQTLAGGEDMHFERAMDILSVGYVHPLMLIVFCLWAVGRASGAIAGELDRGTMELLMAQPMPRNRLILAHLIVDAILIPIVAASLWVGTRTGFAMAGTFQVNAEEFQKSLGTALPFKIIVDPKLLMTDVWAFAPAIVNVAALMFAMSGVTMAISSVNRFRNKALGWSVFAALVQFIVNVLGQLWDSIAVVRPFTFFYYYQPQQIILHGRWTVNVFGAHLNGSLVLFTVGAIGYLIAWRTFDRRDLPAPL